MSVETFRNAVQAELVRRSAPGPMAPAAVTLAQLFQEWSQLSANDQQLVKEKADDGYSALSEFVDKMNPYGNQIIFFPTPEFSTAAQRTDLAGLRAATGIEVAGWLALNHADAPEPTGLSSGEMTSAQEDASFHWEFPVPEGQAADPKAVQKYQITKAIKIPFLYLQQENGQNRFLVAELLIGYGGAGHG